MPIQAGELGNFYFSALVTFKCNEVAYKSEGGLWHKCRFRDQKNLHLFFNCGIARSCWEHYFINLSFRISFLLTILHRLLPTNHCQDRSPNTTATNLLWIKDDQVGKRTENLKVIRAVKLTQRCILYFIITSREDTLHTIYFFKGTETKLWQSQVTWVYGPLRCVVVDKKPLLFAGRGRVDL